MFKSKKIPITMFTKILSLSTKRQLPKHMSDIHSLNQELKYQQALILLAFTKNTIDYMLKTRNLFFLIVTISLINNRFNRHKGWSR